MSETVEFRWPNDEAACASLARSLFINGCVETTRNWCSYGSDFLTNQQPAKPFQRQWSAVAKQDRAYREVFATLTDSQKAKVMELLEHCVSGAVYSTLCFLDQFPHGEAEVFIRDGLCDEGKRRFQIAPGGADLRQDFTVAYHGSH